MLPVLIAAMVLVACGDKPNSPGKTTLNTQPHSESDGSWADDGFLVKNITWRFVAFEIDTNGDGLLTLSYNFTIENGNSVDRYFGYTLRFFDADGFLLLEASEDRNPPVRANGFFDVISNVTIRSPSLNLGVVNSITHMKVDGGFFLREVTN